MEGGGGEVWGGIPEMCGVVGFTYRDEALIRRLTRGLRHRGPDGEGVFVDGKVSLGHARLAIIDLSRKGKQPMEYRGVVISFNGEIYNFREVREELEKLGHRFGSESDTEVILHAYHEWGEGFVRRLSGMWALAIYDRKKGKLVLSRDRFGVKPLYYARVGGKVWFASELAALRKAGVGGEIDRVAMNEFFYRRYISGERTIYEGVKRLLPGCNVVVDVKSGRMKRRRYYRVRAEVERERKRSVKERVAQVEEKLEGVVEAALVADVPVGVFLSGGMDSSLMAALVKEIKGGVATFCMGFGERSYSELEEAERVAKWLGSEHYSQTMAVDDKVIEAVLDRLGEPMGDPALVPTYLLSQMTGKRVKVALSGDGADEVFGGYDVYRGHWWAERLPGELVEMVKEVVALMPEGRGKITRRFMIKRFVERFGKDALERHQDWLGVWLEAERRRLLGREYVDREVFSKGSGAEGLGDIQEWDVEHYLPGDILQKTDTASMSHGLEVRVPYLDEELVALVLSLPDEYRVRWSTGKWLLKEIAAKHIPDWVVKRRKRGFSVPMASLIKESELIRECMRSKAYFGHEMFDRLAVDELWQRFERGEGVAREVWLLAVFNYWWKRWMG